MRHCPSCNSTHVRSGYRPVPFPLRVIGYRELLCDNCNYLYRAFSPLSPKHTKRPPSRKADAFIPAAPKAMPATMELPKAQQPPPPVAVTSRGGHQCPHCGSTNTSRMRRNFVQRRILFLSRMRPYVCNDCDLPFTQLSRG